MKRVFISYAKEGSDIAFKIFNCLKSHHIDVWFDKSSLSCGQNWKYHIHKAINECDYFLILLSTNSVDKVGYVQRELKIAFERHLNYPKSKSFILPVRVNDCNPIEESLKDLQYIDIFPECNYDNGMQQIIHLLNPKSISLRYIKKELNYGNIIDIIKDKDFYERKINPTVKASFTIIQKKKLMEYR